MSPRRPPASRGRSRPIVRCQVRFPASPANNSYKPGFAAALMLKDLKLAQEAAQSAGANTPIGAHAAELYKQYNAAGNEGADFSGIIQYLRERR